MLFDSVTMRRPEIERAVELQFDTRGADYMREHECLPVAEETARRFVQLASRLPASGFLGLQFGMVGDGVCGFIAYSGGGVTHDDYAWLFPKCRLVERAPDEVLPAPDRDGRRVYALQGAVIKAELPEGALPRNCFPTSYSDSARSAACAELVDELVRCRAELRFLASSDAEGWGAILVSLPEEMTLRLRTMLSRAFFGAAAVELTADGALAPLSAGCLAVGLAGFWEKHIYACAARALSELSDADLPLREAGLSARTCAILRRAGINDIQQLRGMSDEALLNIPLLTTRNLAEIRTRLLILRLDKRDGDDADGSGRPAPAPVGGASPAPAPDAAAPLVPRYADMLDELIGLRNVKEQVRKITAFARMKRDMERQGRRGVPVVFNMAFMGNPGTAKTTVARIVAGLLHEIGLLSGSEVVEVGRADLVAGYAGQTATKVKKVFEDAKGKLLFIDEAYSLAERWTGGFGDEAINAIVQEMENRRDETVVVFAGYPDKMAAFFTRNPGLRSRVPFHINFPDYSAEEMAQIAETEARRRGFSIRPDAQEKLLRLCASAAHRPELGNGRFCRNLVEEAVLGYASRVYGAGGAHPEADFALAGEDFSLPENAEAPARMRTIGFLSDEIGADRAALAGTART